ncbi:MAG: hypothetical protein AB9869_03690 [Verrucomicrobiia bacterium]
MLTWKSVEAAAKTGADGWALFSGVRRLSEAADKHFRRETGRHLFSKGVLERHPYVLKGKWGKILWEKGLFFADLRVQRRRVFTGAAKLNPLRSLEFPAIRIVAKMPDWSGLVKPILEPKAKTHAGHLAKSKSTSESQRRTESQSGHSY